MFVDTRGLGRTSACIVLLIDLAEMNIHSLDPGASSLSILR